MPQNTDMTDKPFENIKEPLRNKVLRLTFRNAILLGLITLVIGFALYASSLVDQYISLSFSVASETAAYMHDSYDLQPMMTEVMDIYRGLSDEERANPDSEEYQARFSHIAETEEYMKLKLLLGEIYAASTIDDVYIGLFDRETSALVYLCDPDSTEWDSYPVGYWEPVSQKEAAKFIDHAGEYLLHDTSWTRRYGWICTSGHPLWGSEIEAYAFVLADVRMSDISRRLIRFILLYIIAILLIIIFIGRRLSVYMDKALVTPIRSIADAAQQYSESREAGESSSGYFGGLSISTGDEIEALSHTMSKMERSLGEYEKSLASITAERERVRTELSLATKIQADMLPNVFPAFPDREEFDIHASMEPAKDVGGDFYNFFTIDDDHLCLMMADVSGKGIPASLFMMSSMIMLSDQAALGFSPAEILSRVNEAICANNKEEMFVTVWLGIFEISTGKVTAANAGHEFPALSDGSGHFELFRDPHGFVIGGMEGMKYREYEFTMEHGSRLFLYTDGVTEATDINNELYGTDRLLEALNTTAGASPEETLHTVRRSIADFTGEAEQFDDLTMMCVEFR